MNATYRPLSEIEAILEGRHTNPFAVLGLHNVLLEVYEDNPRAIRAYERAGFKRIGNRRRAKRIGREHCDIIFMDAVADDFPPGFLHDVMQGRDA